MIIDHNNKYVFVSIPKTGSISIQFSLGYGHDIPEPDQYHKGIAAILSDHPECAPYFKAAIVRNPWERLISLYDDFTKKRINQYSAMITLDKPLLSEFKSFEDLCMTLKDSPWLNDIFFKSQFQLLSINNKLAIDFCGRFERLDNDYKEMCKLIGVGNKHLLTMNTGVCSHRNYQQFYSDASRKAIATLYEDDIDAFKYTF